ncbi:ATP-dependent zinc metalloprotease FtsH [Oscillibacter sp. ER4]|uniref:ATP-dependent zinc metalloprotease FtsH n=1 Tax=Oscillibacter sp. ER4 TaxID=1519439 RepID=UPI000691B29C|nr:ATP-dependent zinc metalloprotease FtsH [Oscillibacter sp. ER4]
MEPNNRNNRNRGDKNRRRGGGMWSIVLWALLLTIGVNYLSVMLDQARTAESSCEIAYSELVELVEEGKVKSIEFGDTVFTITPVDGFTYTDDDGKRYDQNYTLFTTIIPDATEKLITLCDEHGVTYTKPYQPPVSPILTFMVSYILPTVLMVGAFMLLMNFITKKSGGMGGIGGIGNVGKANAKVYMEKSTGVTFADVAGQDEAKESLVEIIDFLHNPEKYTAIGAKIPKGALLVGSPGTGKTLLAKAVAGEAKVPFFSISGSDFVEMFVGVGASRVRDLFAEASKVAPCIIFIDEIDTIGKSRDGGRYGGGNDEREQTLNQLLAEMDGFDPSKGVIVLAATNRPEVLDKALLRPGRFDRRITVDRPNLAGRLATLQVHTRGIKLAEDVDLKKVALATAGCVGADLANLANEAALRAVRKGRKLVTQEDMLAAFEFVIAGSEKKCSVLTEFEKKLVAYHEVGHAMVAYKQKNAEPVQKITIVPHTEGSLGYTLLMPEEDKTNLRTRDELMAKIAVSMGGRAAEEVVMNTMTNGASQDIQEATSIARNMVAMYGMSDAVGMVALGSVRNQYLDGGYGLDCAQDTAAIMDREVKRILDECYKDAVQVIRDNREDMDKVVAYLLEKETITGGEMVAILEGRDPSTVEEAYASTRKSEDGFRPSQPSVIEAPAKHISMTSEKIEMPPEDKGEDAQTEDKPSTEPETPDTSAENTDENK